MSEIRKNPENVETVDVSRHRKLRVKANPGFEHAREQHVASLVLSELAEAASSFPIVLVPRPYDDGNLLMAAMLGLKEGENIYYGPQYWESTHVPLSIQRHPFLIAYDDRLPNGEELTTCIEANSPFVSEQQGTPLFNDDGADSDFLKNRHLMLNEMFGSQQITERFIDAVVDQGLTSLINVHLKRQNGEMYVITGLFTIDEEKLQKLSTEQLVGLHQNNFLAPCYLIIASLHQLRRMIRHRNRQGRDQIVDFRIEFNAEPPAPAPQ